MKVKDGYILRQVADSYVVIPLATETVNFDGIINLNKTGALLWDLLKEHTTYDALAETLIEMYDVSNEVALQDVTAFVAKLDSAHCIEY